MEGESKEVDDAVGVRYSFVKVLWGSVVAALTGAICYWSPYIVGKTYMARRNSILNIPSGLFGNTAEDYLAYSYYAVLAVASNFSEFLLGDFRRTAYIAAFSGFFVLYIAFLTWISKPRGKMKFIERIERKRVFKAPFVFLLTSSFLTVFISLAPACIVSVLVVPGYLGAQAALIYVEEEKAIYSKGCLVSNAKGWQCSRLIKGGAIIAEGFLVASSKDWVAIYSQGVTKVLAVNGVDIESGGYDLVK